MKFFNKEEIKIIGFILVVISIVSFFNFRISLRKERDSQRKNALGNLQSGLDAFKESAGMFPLSSDNGKILACTTNDTYFDKELLIWVNLRECEWGKDVLEDFTDLKKPVFLDPIPVDPRYSDGISFTYFSNGTRYQILAHLEGEGEAEFDPEIKSRNITCGDKICNYGRASGNTPIDKSIEEYENELLEKEK